MRQHPKTNHQAPAISRAKGEPCKEKASAEELLAIADRAAALVKRPNMDHAVLLYDENGLPK
jgi:antitoxin VapB